MHKYMPVCILLLITARCGSQAGHESSVYINKALHLEYRYPSAFKLSPSVAAAMMQDTQARVPADQKTAALCVTTPFAAEHVLSFGGTEAIFIIRSDEECLHRNTKSVLDSDYLARVASGALREGLIKFPSARLLDPVSFKVGGRNASFVQGSGSNGPASSGYSAVTCVKQQNNAVCWAFFTPIRSHLPDLFATTASFDGETPAAVVPADLLLANPIPNP